MKSYIVNEGDSPDSIAQRFGFESWKVVYDHKENAPLRKLRGPNEIKPGDEVMLPVLPEKVTLNGGAASSFVADPGAKKWPPVVFDAHMHIQSGNCTPLPPIYGLLGERVGALAVFGKLHASRGVVNAFGRAAAWIHRIPIAPISRMMPLIGEWSCLPTNEIGHRTVGFNDKLIKSTYPRFDSAKRLATDAEDSYLGMSIVLTMDMDYCHMDGYWGVPIYQEDPETGAVVHYERRTGVPEHKGKAVEIPDSEWVLHETWEQQRELTEEVAVSHPFRMLPMYHYEPRRYLKAEPWDAPFSQVATPSQPGLYVGFKMYSSQGYMPSDFKNTLPDGTQRLPHLKDFFSRCASEGIPVMTHCTPSGFYTHQRRFFLDLEPDAAKRKKYTPDVKPVQEARVAYLAERVRFKKDLKDSRKMEEARLKLKELVKSYRKEAQQERLRYFKDHYIHPEAWRALLKEVPSLKVCLAHFASDEAIWVRGLRKALQDKPGLQEEDAKDRKAEERLISNWEKEQKEKGRPLDAFLDGDGLVYEKDWIDSIVKLCADFENVYTDISYLPLVNRFPLGLKYPYWKKLAEVLESNPKMLDRVMFGTDWYMVLGDSVKYDKWVEDSIVGLEHVSKYLGKVAKGINLFHQFAIVNPLRFYRLTEVAPQLKAALEEEIPKRQTRKKKQDKMMEQLNRNYAILMRAQEPLAELQKDHAPETGFRFI
ncbi:hypothetical protein ACLESO_38715 [Pyxidicoccus sp. 3LG]